MFLWFRLITAFWLLKLTVMFTRGYLISTGLGSSTCDQSSLICFVTNPLNCDNTLNWLCISWKMEPFALCWMKKHKWELQSENTHYSKSKSTEPKRRKLENSETKEKEVKRGWRRKAKKLAIGRQRWFFLSSLNSTGPAFWSPLNSWSTFYRYSFWLDEYLSPQV